MYNHKPQNYQCPLCLAAQGIENEHTMVVKQDVVYKNTFVTAFITSRFRPHNPGHVVIVPNKHFENLYDLPDEYAGEVQKVAKQIAIAMKQTYSCDGISTAQHNEPSGNQDVWHYHMHVFPRYKDDAFYEHMLEKKFAPPEDRKPYADKLKNYFSKQNK